MKKKQEAHLVFIPSIGISHLVPTLQFARHLILHDPRFTITFLIMPESFRASTTDAFIESVSSSFPRINFIYLPPADLPPPDTEPGIPFLSLFVENHKPLVKQELTQIINNSTIPVVGLVVDVFTTTMVDIANDFNISSYVYFTSGATTVGLMLHSDVLDSQIAAISALGAVGDDLVLPSFVHPVPVLALPSLLQNNKTVGYSWYLHLAKELSEVKGIIVNSVFGLEPHAIDAIRSFSSYPKVYPVGPLLDLDRPVQNQVSHEKIIEWLDGQRLSSVVFLCFGSRGALSEPQVKEIAKGLENSGHRFLWALRKPTSAKFGGLADYENLEDVLPEGFLDRTVGRGLIVGWVPQIDVLAHKATGGFVSHCGWNSILESLWFGVPILTWPIDAEQALNAFEMVRELGLAVALRGEYKVEDEGRLMTAVEVESGVRRLMDDKEGRNKVKDVSNRCRTAVMEGGSSFTSLGCLIDDLVTGVGSDDDVLS